MSGGHFDYAQHNIKEIETEIEQILERLKAGELDGYVEDKAKLEETLKLSHKIMQLAYILAQRIDWFMSGDDGEASFYRRLEDEVENIKEL